MCDKLGFGLWGGILTQKNPRALRRPGAVERLRQTFAPKLLMMPIGADFDEERDDHPDRFNVVSDHTKQPPPPATTSTITTNHQIHQRHQT